MSEINLLRDASFLQKLDLENIKTFFVKILILNRDETPLRAIEGRTSAGSISISGSSAVRRAGNITFLAEEELNDLTDIDNLLSMNKKIKILVGIENTIDDIHDKVIWFNQGIFVITNPSLSHTVNGVNISLQFKDKMCLLNGECGGNLPTSITFDTYDQIIGFMEDEDIDGNKIPLTSFPEEPNNYTVYRVKPENENEGYYMWDSTKGWSVTSLNQVGDIAKVPQRIFDIIQTLVCNYGGESFDKIIINDVPLQLKQIVRYIGSDNLYYNIENQIYSFNGDGENWIPFSYNQDCGYTYTDFIYPGGSSGLVSAIGDNVCTILDKIKTVLGNYEYFYDINGNFVFQEIKNYLNTQYDPSKMYTREYTLGNDGKLILDAENYYLDISNTSSSIYTFDEGSALISSYTNTPSYTNIKNDFHIWGKNQDANVIHYHVVVKEKPQEPFDERLIVEEKDISGKFTGKIRLALGDETEVKSYTPTDWRAELYLRGLEKKRDQKRPDIYEQEILDLFDSIYDMREQKFKTDIVNYPNDLNYWIDYICPTELADISVDVIGSKIYSYQQDKIIRLYSTDIPNVVMINKQASNILKNELTNKGESVSQVEENVYNSIAIGTVGYTAEEVARNLLYQYTAFTSSISIASIPIYYLEVNNRITIFDRASGIFGDYVVNNINIPLNAQGTMLITATKALSRD